MGIVKGDLINCCLKVNAWMLRQPKFPEKQTNFLGLLKGILL